MEFVGATASTAPPYRFAHIRHYGIIAFDNRAVLAALQVELDNPPVAVKN